MTQMHQEVRIRKPVKCKRLKQNHNELKSASKTQDHPAVCVFEGFKYCIEVRNDTKKRNVLRQIE